MKKTAPFFVLLASVLWGSMGIVTRYIADIGFHTRQITAVRICVSTIVLAIFLLLIDRKKLKIEKKDIKWFLGTGIGSLFVNNLAYAETVQRASLSVAVVLLYTAPFFVMILSLVFFKEKITFQKIVALLMSFVGCVLVVGLSDTGLGEHKMITLFIGLCSGLGYSLYTILGKAIMDKYDSLTLTFYTFLFASFATLIICEPVDTICLISDHLSKMALVIVGSVVTLAFPYIFYSIGLKYMESSKAPIIASFEVVAASLWGVLLYQETLNIYNIFGIILVVSALIFLQINFHKNT